MDLDAYEILVTLKDLSEQGFHKVQGNMAALDKQAALTQSHTNALNDAMQKHASTLERYGAGSAQAAASAEKVSKAESQVAKDMAAAEGKSGGGGVMGMVSSLGLLPGPATIAVGGLLAVGAAGVALTKTYDEIQSRDKLLDVALKDHGDSLAKEKDNLEALTSSNEQYGQNAAATEGAVTELAQAGQSWSQISGAMPAILDLAAAKHEDLGTAAKQVELAEMGNARALKELGIILPSVSASAADVGKAHDAETKAAQKLKDAQAQLTVVEDSLRNKHTLTAAESLRLQKAHEQVTAAANALKAAQDKVTLAEQGGIDKAGRQKLVLGDLEKQIGGSRNAATSMQQAQARLSDAWERGARVAGPVLQGALAGLFGILANTINFVFGTAIPTLAGLWNWFTKLPAPIQFLLNPIAALVAHFGDLVNIVQRVIGLLGQVVGAAKSAGDAVAHSPIGAVAGGVGNVAGGVGGAIGNVGNFLGGLVPHFATGGWVPAKAGGTVIVAGEGGEDEAVIPRSKLALARGGGGHVFNITIAATFPPTASQARDLVDAIEAELARRIPLRSSMALGGGF